MPKSIITLDIMSELEPQSLETYMQVNEEKVLAALKALLPGVTGFVWGDAEHV